MSKGHKITSTPKNQTDQNFKDNLVEALAHLSNNVYFLNETLDKIQSDINIVKNNIVYMNTTKK
jgi:hypothetical protein